MYETADTDFSNWTVLGFPSVHLKNKEKPTMSLNFRSMNEQEIKAMVIHQFGHALGLGHSLMRPEEWEDIKEYVDIQKMAMESHGQYSEDIFEREWTGKGMEGEVEVNYDEKSVMQYRYVPELGGWDFNWWGGGGGGGGRTRITLI